MASKRARLSWEGHEKGPLVFDIGANFGQSCERYLAQGFEVVAVEPNPVAVKALASRLSADLDSGRLHIEEAALVSPEACAEKVELHVNEEDSEWSSLLELAGKRYDTSAQTIKVPGISLKALYERYGQPWYIKVDTEGGEGDVLQQLQELPLPVFLSVELNSLVYLKEAAALGYDAFKVVPQARHQAERLLDKHGRPLTHAGDFGEAAVGSTGTTDWLSMSEVLAECQRLCFVHAADLSVLEFQRGPPRWVEKDFATLRACFPVESRNDEEWYDLHCRLKSSSSQQPLSEPPEIPNAQQVDL